MHRHRSRVPSPWITRHAGLIAAGGHVLDLACGGGRHTRYLRDRGLKVSAIDIDPSGVCRSRGRSAGRDRRDGPRTPWNSHRLQGRRFDAVVVTDYLFRPLLVPLVDCLEPGGVFLYETFALGNERFGRPRRPGIPIAAWRAAGAGRRPSHGHRLRAPHGAAAHAEDRTTPLCPEAYGVRVGNGPGREAARSARLRAAPMARRQASGASARRLRDKKKAAGFSRQRGGVLAPRRLAAGRRDRAPAPGSWRAPGRCAQARDRRSRCPLPRRHRPAPRPRGRR